MTEHEAIGRYLRGLPTAVPPAGLGARIVERHGARRRRRRHAVAFAAAAVFALAVVRPWWPAPLESPVADTGAGVDVVAVRALDRELQAAYAGDADLFARERLWRLREAATRPLADPDARPPRLVRL